MFEESDKVVCIMDVFYGLNGEEKEEIQNLYQSREKPEIGQVYCITKTEKTYISDDTVRIGIFLVGFPQMGIGFPAEIFIKLEEFKRLPQEHKKIYLN